ncbi:MAG: hypothetical protein NVSMB12_19880 [Acidimicrobiales bacterium]
MGLRIRLLAAMTVVIAATFAPTVAAHAATWLNPVRPENRGAPIPGAVNGELTAGQLVTVEGTCQLAPGAAGALTQLFAAARAAGVNLGPESCYRSVQGQNSASTNACASGNCACAATGGTPSSGGTSIHGWGKAVDFNENGTTLTFDSGGYRWLKANAGRYAFNHPSWAEPGGSTCPEAWHWEWVGDGGSLGPAPHAVAMSRVPDGSGYRVTTTYGAVTSLGSATDQGSPDLSRLVGPVMGMATTPTGNGYWLVAADGGIFSFGDATFHGSTGATHLNQPIVGMTATPTGNGYWLVAADGGIFSFGDATFHGSAP